MNEQLQFAVEALKERFGGVEKIFRGDVEVILAPETIVPACQTLRDEFNFEMLVDVTAVDYWPQEEPRFHVVYRIRSLKHNLIIGLRVPVDGDNPALSTIESVYPNANWFEREVWDMFGVRFEGHSDMRRILMPYEWVGHPLRKDYPLGYEEIQFTFNFDEINVRKPYARRVDKK